MMIDYFTKWIEAKALAKTTVEIVHNFIWIDIIYRYGVPLTIIADNGSQFVDKSLKEFSHSQGIRSNLLMFITRRRMTRWRGQTNSF